MGIDTDVKLIYKMVSKLDKKIDKIQETQLSQAIVLERNTVIVDKHEQRSTKLEEWVSSVHGVNILLEEQVKTIMDSNTKVVAHVNTINRFIEPFKAIPKIIGFLMLFFTFVAALFGIFKFFYKG